MKTTVISPEELLELVREKEFVGQGCERTTIGDSEKVWKLPSEVVLWIGSVTDEFDEKLRIENVDYYVERQSFEELLVWEEVKNTQYRKYFTPILEVLYFDYFEDPIIVMPRETVALDNFDAETKKSLTDTSLRRVMMRRMGELLGAEEDAMLFLENMRLLCISDVHEDNFAYSKANGFRVFDYGLATYSDVRAAIKREKVASGLA